MKKFLFTSILAFAALTMSAADAPSLICDYPTGHENNPNFGNPDAHIYLSVSKVSANSISVKVKTRNTLKLDRLLVNVPYVTSASVGSDLTSGGSDELEAILTFDVPPAKFQLEVKWSTVSWEGMWMINNAPGSVQPLEIPFDGICGFVYHDVVKPTMGAATVVRTTHNSALVSLAATDKDDNNVDTEVVTYILNDATNGIVDKKVEVNAAGQYLLTGLTPSTTYSISVTAEDVAKNISDNLTTLNFSTTQLADFVLVDDFETGNKGWAPVEGYCAVVENPFKGLLNTSNNVLLTVRGATQTTFWTGAILDPASYGKEYKYLHAYMYRDTNANKPMVKLTDSPAFETLPVASTTIVKGEWQDVVFDITGAAQVDFILIMADATRDVALGTELKLYVDDIILSNDATPRTSNGSGIANGSTQTYSVVGEVNNVKIENLSNESVYVYNINGQLASHQQANGSTLNIALEKGLYLVKIANQTTKVLVK